MFLRFITPIPHEASHVSLGLFQAAFRVRDAECTEPWVSAHVADVLAWFGDHLHSPEDEQIRLPPWHGDRDKVIYWFRPSAHACLRRMRELEVLLREEGWMTCTLRTHRPGRVVYADAQQVAAIPFRDGVR